MKVLVIENCDKMDKCYTSLTFISGFDHADLVLSSFDIPKF